jgi:hypothetical protein
MKVNFTLKYYSLFILLGVGFLGFSQTYSLKLTINHKLGSSPFAYNQVAYNNLGNNFNVNLLMYYISKVKIVHDKGKVTSLDNLYILVDASKPTSINLGDLAIDSLEKIQFSIGVNTPQNNQDPTAWPENHPLAPKSPSMHWGWSAGYRFIVMEGTTGDGLKQMFQIHGLGNVNYFKTEVATSGTKEGNVINIALDADYTKVLNNIPLWNGVISHGETDESVTALQNCRDFVFSPAGQALLTPTAEYSNDFVVFPNPNNGVFEIKSNVDWDGVKIVNQLGQTVFQGNNNSQLSISNSGVYFMHFEKNGQFLGTKLISVQ